MAKRKILGASLYVPTTHKDLNKIASGELLGEVRSLIFCTEDAVTDSELNFALFNLSLALQEMKHSLSVDRFVRVRNPDILKRVLEMPGSENLTGFVLPKITRRNFDDYFYQIKNTHHQLMPTLETVEVFDESEMKLLRQRLEELCVQERILALRIGGNDLLALLGIRRPRNVTIYSTPIGPIISRLVTTFSPHGFSLTGPVFEHLDNSDLLAQEVQKDIDHGLIGKTAIHPSQITLIEKKYRVNDRDFEMALQIINPDCPAVFRMYESMCEVATHRSWAYKIIEQANIFGFHSAGGDSDNSN